MEASCIKDKAFEARLFGKVEAATGDGNCVIACLIYEISFRKYWFPENQPGQNLGWSWKAMKGSGPQMRWCLVDSCQEKLPEVAVCCQKWHARIKVHAKRWPLTFSMNNVEMHVKCQLTSDANKTFPQEFGLYSFGIRTLGRRKRKSVQIDARKCGDQRAVYHNSASGMGWLTVGCPTWKELFNDERRRCNPPLHPSLPPDMRQSSWWIRPRSALMW